MHVAILARARTVASADVRLDRAGAFGVELALPPDAPAGDGAVLASFGGTSGGAAIHVDGVGDVVLSIAASCGAACAPDAAVPVIVSAKRADGTPAAGRDLRVHVVRVPHVLAPGVADDGTAWGTAPAADWRMRTDDDGFARASIPAPTDGLPSTYGIVATSGAATASARVVASAGRIALSVTPERADLDVGEPAAFAVRGFDASDGRPAAGLAVRVRLVHGPATQEQPVTLDADGRARAVFRNVGPGTSLAFAQADVDGKGVIDAGAVNVAPQALLGNRARRSAELQIATDKPRYRVGEKLRVTASLAGAIGDAFVDFEGARAMGEQTLPGGGGRASAVFTVPETVGDAALGVAFVRDGALEYATQRVAIDGPGHARATTLASDKPAYAPGSIAHVTIGDGICKRAQRSRSGSATCARRAARRSKTRPRCSRAPE